MPDADPLAGHHRGHFRVELFARVLGVAEVPNGRRQYLWRAVDQNGDVLDILVQSRRDRRAAARFLRVALVPTFVHPRRCRMTAQ